MAGGRIRNAYDELLRSPLGFACRVEMAKQQFQRPELVPESKSLNNIPSGWRPADDIHRRQSRAHMLRKVVQRLQVSRLLK